MSAPSLAGKVVALIGLGSDRDRALAIACAEAGADLALATKTPDQAAEFAMNSIANEAWVIGSEQFVRVMDASSAADLESFAEETWARYGQCDAVILPQDDPEAAATAFCQRFAKAGHGVIVFASAPEASEAAAASLQPQCGASGVRVTALAGHESDVVGLLARSS